jgi:hypothetical protein
MLALLLQRIETLEKEVARANNIEFSADTPGTVHHSETGHVIELR